MADWTGAVDTWAEQIPRNRFAKEKKEIDPKAAVQKIRDERTRSASTDREPTLEEMSTNQRQRANWENQQQPSDITLSDILQRYSKGASQDRGFVYSKLAKYKGLSEDSLKAGLDVLKKKHAADAKFREGKEKIAAIGVEKKADIDEKQRLLLNTRKDAYATATTQIDSINNKISQIANEDPHRAVFSSIPGILAMALGSYVEARSGGKLKNTAFKIMQSRVDALAQQKLSRINSLRGKLSSEDRLLKNMLAGISTDEEKLVLIKQALISDLNRQIVPINEQYQLDLDKIQIQEMKNGVINIEAEIQKQLVNMNPGYLDEAKALVAAETSWNKLKDPFSTVKGIMNAQAKDQIDYKDYARKETGFTAQSKKSAAQMVVLSRLTDTFKDFVKLDKGKSATFTRWLMGESVDNKILAGIFHVMGDDKKFAKFVQSQGFVNAISFEKAAETQGKRITKLDFQQVLARLPKLSQSKKDFFEGLREMGNEAGANWRRLYSEAAVAPIYTTLFPGHPNPSEHSAKAKIFRNHSMPKGISDTADKINKWQNDQLKLVPGTFPPELLYSGPGMGVIFQE